MKRSQAVSLVLLAGAGASALLIARLDPSQDEEDALIYRTEQECVDARDRSPADCRAEHEAAGTAYRTSAPRYEDQPTCEAHHGNGQCRPASDVGSGEPPGAYVPLLAAYMIGRRPGQGMPVQPLYDHQPADESPPGGGSWSQAGAYCSGGGSRIYRASGGGYGATVPRSVSRAPTTSYRSVSRGGFGFTGRGIAAHGGHGGGHGSAGS